MITLFGTKFDNKDLLCFVTGLLFMIKLRILGTIGVGEIMALTFLPFIPIKACWKNESVRRYVMLGVLWLVAIVFSDLYNSTETVRFAKGFFNVVILLLLVPFGYWMLKDNPQRILVFWAGYGISRLFSYYFLEYDEFKNEIDAESWIVYAYLPLAFGICGFVYYKGKRLLSLFLMEGFAVWTLFNFSRHVFLVITIGICMLLVLYKGTGHLNGFRKTSTKKILALLLVAAIGFYGVSWGYETLASSHMLGERAYNKYMMQKNSAGGLASGRVDFLQAIYAVGEKPLLGYGSYPDTDKEFYKNFYKSTEFENITGKIPDHMPTHSHILGAWIMSGLLSVPFWVYTIYIVLTYLFRYSLYDRRLALFSVTMSVYVIWNFMFSPFQARLDVDMFIVFVMIEMGKARHYLKYKCC